MSDGPCSMTSRRAVRWTLEALSALYFTAHFARFVWFLAPYASLVKHMWLKALIMQQLQITRVISKAVIAHRDPTCFDYPAVFLQRLISQLIVLAFDDILFLTAHWCDSSLAPSSSDSTWLRRSGVRITAHVQHASEQVKLSDRNEERSCFNNEMRANHNHAVVSREHPF